MGMASLLRRHDVFQPGLHLHSRKAGRVPAAAEGFDELHGSIEALARKLRATPLGLKRLAIRIHDFKITHDPAR